MALGSSASFASDCKPAYLKQIKESGSLAQGKALKTGLSVTGGAASSLGGYLGGMATSLDAADCSQSNSNGNGCTVPKGAQSTAQGATLGGVAGGASSEIGATKASTQSVKAHRMKKESEWVIKMIQEAEMGDGKELREFRDEIEKNGTSARPADLGALSQVIVSGNQTGAYCKTNQLFTKEEFSFWVESRVKP